MPRELLPNLAVRDLERTKAFFAALGFAFNPPPQDHGFMYAWSFYDPDGHHWEPFWMDSAAVQPAG